MTAVLRDQDGGTVGSCHIGATHAYLSTAIQTLHGGSDTSGDAKMAAPGYEALTLLPSFFKEETLPTIYAVPVSTITNLNMSYSTDESSQ